MVAPIGEIKPATGFPLRVDGYVYLLISFNSIERRKGKWNKEKEKRKEEGLSLCANKDDVSRVVHFLFPFSFFLSRCVFLSCNYICGINRIFLGL